MPGNGFKTITVDDEHKQKVTAIKTATNAESETKVVEDLIDQKYEEVIPNAGQ